jgi:hypothetical protein
MYLSPDAPHLISLPSTLEWHERMSCTLFSSLQCALCNADHSSAIELMNRRHKRVHQYVWNYMCSWDTGDEHLTEELIVGNLDWVLFWQFGGWTLGLIQHRGRSSQVPCKSCIRSSSSWHSAWINFFFSFSMILIFCHQNLSFVAGIPAAASGPRLELLIGVLWS